MAPKLPDCITTQAGACKAGVSVLTPERPFFSAPTVPAEARLASAANIAVLAVADSHTAGRPHRYSLRCKYHHAAQPGRIGNQ